MLSHQGWIIGLVIPESDFIGQLIATRMLNMWISLFILLTGILIVLSYSLLDMIDRHRGIPLIILISAVVLADIAAMAGIFFRYMRSSARNNRNSAGVE